MRRHGEHSGTGLAGRLRRALARFLTGHDMVGLTITCRGNGGVAALRVMVRLRGARRPDDGQVLALHRRLRAVLGLLPGAGLPVLVIGLTEEGAQAAGQVRQADPWREGPSAMGAGVRLQTGMALVPAGSTIREKGSGSRAPPSPWCRRLDACG